MSIEVRNVDYRNRKQRRAAANFVKDKEDLNEYRRSLAALNQVEDPTALIGRIEFSHCVDGGLVANIWNEGCSQYHEEFVD